jgi:hypothetical protein
VRKFMILGALVAMVVAALAIPALAQHEGGFFGGDQGAFDEERFEARQDHLEDRADERDDRFDARAERFEERFMENGFFFGEDGLFGDEEDFFGDENRNDNEAGISQSSEQNASSGNVNQSFNVSGGGDNSNQCVGLQGVANTGNAQNQVSVLQYGSQADEFSFEDSGASINVSPTNATRCDQQVNQAASAFGR